MGRIITEKALNAGHQVVASARDISQLKAVADAYGDSVCVFPLDVTCEEQAKEAVSCAVSRFGRLDVLVNNAGYGDTRPFEEVPSEDFRRVIDTCLFGIVNLTRAALPVMRHQRSGHIIQISSVGGRFATVGNAAYHAAKWAVGGFTEAVAPEVAPFGVKVTALEPGGMRTNWGKRAFSNRGPMLPEYESSVGALIQQLEAYWGHESGDPAKVAEVVLAVAAAEVLPPHILLGTDALDLVRSMDAARAIDADRWSAISRWTDFTTNTAMPLLPSD